MKAINELLSSSSANVAREGVTVAAAAATTLQEDSDQLQRRAAASDGCAACHYGAECSGGAVGQFLCGGL